MEQGIFISYSNLDKKKLDLLEREIILDGRYKPIVIANNREALKPLAKKVSDGLIQAEFVVPIITKNSISNQWVNQEIGFATALNKTIIPIIDKDLIDSLKGFIHKQVDLPYSFFSSEKAVVESRNFLKAIKSLIDDLPSQLNTKQPTTNINQVSDLEASIKKLEEAKNSKQELELKSKYLNSTAGMSDAITEAANILFWAEKKINELSSRNIIFDYKKREHLPSIEVRYGDFKFDIFWTQQYTNLNMGAYLSILKFKLVGHNFIRLEKQIYTYDIDKEQPVWSNEKQKNQKLSHELINENINWLITENAKNI